MGIAPMAPARSWHDDSHMTSVDRTEHRASDQDATGPAEMTTSDRMHAQAVSTVASSFADDQETISEYRWRTRPVHHRRIRNRHRSAAPCGHRRR
jgi:hypothetical protein